MNNKWKDIKDDILRWIDWYITGPLYERFIMPTVSIDYVKEHDGSWIGNSNKYQHYWIGDFNTGKQVKVRR